MSEKVRIASIQSRHVPTCDGLRTNPYSDDFSMDDLLLSIERRIAWYGDLFARAGKKKCNLAVITEDFTRLSSCMTFLDDRSVFRTAVEKQTDLIAERLGAAAILSDTGDGGSEFMPLLLFLALALLALEPVLSNRRPGRAVTSSRSASPRFLKEVAS